MDQRIPVFEVEIDRRGAASGLCGDLSKGELRISMLNELLSRDVENVSA
jgi:hypothetical protein